MSSVSSATGALAVTDDPLVGGLIVSPIAALGASGLVVSVVPVRREPWVRELPTLL